MIKDQATQEVAFQAVSATDGSAVTTGSPTVYVTVDGGTQGTGSGTTVHKGNGVWVYTATAADSNGDHVVFTFTLTGCINQSVNVYPVTLSDYTNLTAVNGSTDAADGIEGTFAPGAAGGVASVGIASGGAGVSVTAGTYSATDGTDFNSGSTSGTGLVLSLTFDSSGLTGASVTTAGTGYELTDEITITTTEAAAIAGGSWFVEPRIEVDTLTSSTPVGATYAKQEEIGTHAENIENIVDKLDAMLEYNTSYWRFNTNALEQAPSGSGGGASAADIADAVLDEIVSGHTTAGSLGKVISDILADTDDLQTSQGNWVTATGFSTFDPANDTVANVTTVATCTTNSDMRGTDNALLASSAPVNFSALAITAGTGYITGVTNNVNAEVVSLSTIALAQFIGQDIGVYSLTEGSVLDTLRDAVIDDAPTSSEVADAVWNEPRAGHTAAGTFGEGVDVTTSSAIDVIGPAVWSQPWSNYVTGDTSMGDLMENILNPTDGLVVQMAGSTFNTATDSLEAIRDRGDAAWTTGSGGGGGSCGSGDYMITINCTDTNGAVQGVKMGIVGTSLENTTGTDGTAFLNVDGSSTYTVRITPPSGYNAVTDRTIVVGSSDVTEPITLVETTPGGSCEVPPL